VKVAARATTQVNAHIALGLGAQPMVHGAAAAILVDSGAPESMCYEHRYSYPYGIMVDITARGSSTRAKFFSYTYAKCAGNIALALAHGLPNLR